MLKNFTKKYQVFNKRHYSLKNPSFKTQQIKFQPFNKCILYFEIPFSNANLPHGLAGLSFLHSITKKPCIAKRVLKSNTYIIQTSFHGLLINKLFELLSDYFVTEDRIRSLKHLFFDNKLSTVYFEVHDIIYFTRFFPLNFDYYGWIFPLKIALLKKKPIQTIFTIAVNLILVSNFQINVRFRQFFNVLFKFYEKKDEIFIA